MKPFLIRMLSVLGVLFAACSHSPVKRTSTFPQDGRLSSIISDFTEKAKRLDPFSAPYFNVEEDLGKFGDYPSPDFFEREKQLIRNSLTQLAEIDPAKLSEEEQKTFRLFKDDLEVSERGFAFPLELLDFHQMSNRLLSYLDDTSQTLTNFPFDSVKHYEDFVKRSEGFPLYVDRQIEVLRRGIREGITLNCPAARGVVNTYRPGLEAVVEKNPFYRPIGFMPKTVASSDRERLERSFRSMIQQRIVPGFRKFDAFYQREYLPHCRKEFGIGSLPHGREWYRYSIEHATNLSLDPKAIHETGLREVARISAEMEQVKKELGFSGSLREFQASLTRDPRYFFKSGKEMFEAFEKVKAIVAAKVPSYFSVIPKTDYRIVESSNPEDAAARYNDPNENVPYGRFVVNTKNLRSVPIYRVTTLSMHESIPGHHFQLALQFEIKDRLSEYRRRLFFSSAFAEGWGLYAEYLGNEMGMFSDPMQRLGHLNDEMLRAVRLVVDTGIHGLGWSREKAVNYMKSHLASDEKDIGNEVNRYSVWPGQALGYKLGQLKILELRRYAEKELGPRFDIRGFHAAVIGSGTVSLGVLDSQVREWVAKVRRESITN